MAVWTWRSSRRAANGTRQLSVPCRCTTVWYSGCLFHRSRSMFLVLLRCWRIRRIVRSIFFFLSLFCSSYCRVLHSSLALFCWSPLFPSGYPCGVDMFMFPCHVYTHWSGLHSPGCLDLGMVPLVQCCLWLGPCMYSQHDMNLCHLYNAQTGNLE